MQYKTKAIIRHVVLVHIFTGIGGFFLGLTNPSLEIYQLGLFNIVFLILSFLTIGSIVAELRFRHLRAVANIIWLSSIFNVFIIPVDNAFIYWLFSIIIIHITAFIGGVISLLLVPPKNNTQNVSSSNSSQKKYLSVNQWIIGIASGVITDLIVEAIKGGLA